MFQTVLTPLTACHGFGALCAGLTPMVHGGRCSLCSSQCAYAYIASQHHAPDIYRLCYAGLFEMDCVVVSKREWIWYLIGPLLGLAAIAVAVVWLVLTYRARLLEAWETRHIHALKHRSAIHLCQFGTQSWD